LHPLGFGIQFAENVAGAHAGVVNELSAKMLEDTEGSFPEWLVDLTRNQADAPHCSDLAARI
jgi:hypothetical protein